VTRNPWIPTRPTTKQAAFLALNDREALYGGAAGGGKSEALLMAAAMYVDVPGYAAILFRRTYQDLALPQALMSRSHEWWGGTAARWNGQDHSWTFPSGATVSFGYLAHENHKYRYQSAEFQFIGFDELTQFPESSYAYLFSRLRRKAGVQVPLRMRAASNPGGEGHAWVFERFVMPGSGRVFIPAGLADNPHIDRDEYERSLAELDDTTRKQLLEGMWVTDPAGKPYKREWWRGQNRYDPDDIGLVRAHVVERWISWDTAMKDSAENDYSGYIVAEVLDDYRLLIRRAWRARLQFPDLVDAIEAAAREHNRDGKLRGIVIEDRVSGTSAIQTLRAAAKSGVSELIIPFEPERSKEERAQRAAVWAQRGCILLPHPTSSVPWLAEFEHDIYEFPDIQHKEYPDVLSQIGIYLEHYLAAGWHARAGVSE